VSKVHELKIEKKYFDARLQGIKQYEIRLNDRGFKVGDVLHLREIVPERKYTGREELCEVTMIHELPGDNFIPTVVLSTKRLLLSGWVEAGSTWHSLDGNLIAPRLK